jgi:glucosamine kinase
MITMRKILAVDAGGTTTRAVVLDLSGNALGYGRAGSGNPTASGIDDAAAAIQAAAARALGAERPTDPSSSALVALAGAQSIRFRDLLAEHLAPYGFTGTVTLESDLAGTFFSGTHRQHGYALIAGTGAVAARISHGSLEHVSGGIGWLLGDTGSGFWIGHHVARAVIAALDGQGPNTALSGLLLEQLAIERSAERERGRPRNLEQTMNALYALRPVELARFAPLAFQAAGDVVAQEILASAASALAGLLEAVHDPDTGGPVVLGGSVAAAGLRAAPEIFVPPLTAAAHGAPLISVADGMVGAAVMALRQVGTAVDAELFSRLRNDIAQLAHQYMQHERHLP